MSLYFYKKIPACIHNALVRITPGTVRFRRFTDFISDRQKIIFWGFDFQALTNAYGSHDYSIPVRRALFAAFRKIAGSRSGRICCRRFTVWMGDYGPWNEYFLIAVPSRMHSRVRKIFDHSFGALAGFMFFDIGSIPHVPLVPMYRYEHGTIIEYISGSTRAGLLRIDEEFDTGLRVVCREYLSAEGFDVRQRYAG